MTLVQGRALFSTPVKMEDRKRPAYHEHDGVEPPLKRQATAVNGASKTHIDTDMPWKDDLEVSKPYHSQQHPASPRDHLYLFFPVASEG